MTAQTPAENAAAEAAGRRGNASTLSEVDQSTRDALYSPPLRDREPTEYELAILRGLQRQPHVYQGTVDPVTIAERRAANRRARRQRRGNQAALIRQARLDRVRRNPRYRRGHAPDPLNLRIVDAEIVEDDS